MIYVTRYRQVHDHQVTFEDVLNNFENKRLFSEAAENTTNQTITRLYKEEEVWRCRNLVPQHSVAAMGRKLYEFNMKWDFLRQVERQSLYKTFFMPKRSGGLRRIDAPNDDLKMCLSELALLLKSFGLMHHAAAYAYVEHRCTVDALRYHQRNESNWFEKTDLSNFFGSTTFEFTMNQLKHIFPLNLLEGQIYIGNGGLVNGTEELQKALELGFLNGGLPQGTPLSPFLTNWIFVPLDYELMKEFSARKIVYTRYADDMLLSAKEKFPKELGPEIIRSVIAKFGAPYVLKDEKTRYGSRKGANWNLGLMLNAANDITVGSKNKKQFKAMVNNFIMDTMNGKRWPLEDVQHLSGLLSYYLSVEKEYFTHMIMVYNEKYHVNFGSLLKHELS